MRTYMFKNFDINYYIQLRYEFVAEPGFSLCLSI